jgi:hypothetical protein
MIDTDLQTGPSVPFEYFAPKAGMGALFSVAGTLSTREAVDRTHELLGIAHDLMHDVAVDADSHQAWAVFFLLEMAVALAERARDSGPEAAKDGAAAD